MHSGKMWICNTYGYNPSCTPDGGRFLSGVGNPEVKGKDMTDRLSHIVHVRIDDDLLAELIAEAGSRGYTKLSPYLRFIITSRDKKQMKKTSITQEAVSSIEQLSSEFRRIGVLYNQFVASYNKAILMTDRNGNPCVTVKETQRNQLGLMDLTLEMTDKIHKLMDYFGIGHNRVRTSTRQK